MAKRRATTTTYRDNNGSELCRISGGLFTKKRGWDSLNQELCENYYPMRADYTGELSLGDDFALDLMDSYPVQARSQLGDAIEAMLRQDQWFHVSSGDEELDKQPDIARGLERATQVTSMIMNYPKAHVKRGMKMCDHDWVTVGAGVLSWEESQNRTYAVLKSHHPRDNAWMANEDGDVDVNHRRMKKSARDLINGYNEGRYNRPHPDVFKAEKDDPGHKFTILHCLMPGEDYERLDTATTGRRPPFVSVLYDEEHEMVLREKPAPWFNYMIPRWWILGDVQWGFSSVAINTLPDGRMAQALGAMTLEGAEKAIDPPIIGAGDVFRNGVNLWTGGFSMADLSDGRNLQDVMTVVDTAKNLNIGIEMKQELRAMIAEGFLLNKLMLPNTKEMTAFEVNWRTDEFRRAALPFFSPIEDEYHSLVLEGAFRMAMQMGLMKPDELPRQLAERDVHWTFTSPINSVEGQRVAANFRQVVADVGSIIQLDPTASTRVNWGHALQDALNGDGAKPKWLLTDAELEQKAAESKQANDASAAAGALQRGASVAADVSNALMTGRNAGLLPAPGAAPSGGPPGA